MATMLEETRTALAERGITLEEIADIVRDLQLPYHPDLNLAECLVSVETVLKKREVQNAVLTGIALDKLAEQKLLPGAIQRIIESDDGLYGIDEILALSITNVYGSIGLTNFGYLDKTKPAIIGRLNDHKLGNCHTFADDLVAAIAAAAAARIAHSRRSD